MGCKYVLVLKCLYVFIGSLVAMLNKPSLVCAQGTVVYLDYTSYRSSNDSSKDPPEKLLDMIKVYPRAKFFRMEYEMDALRSVYRNNVFYDRQKKILKLHGDGWYKAYADRKEVWHYIFFKPHYQFYKVDEGKLRRVVSLSKRQVIESEGIGPDTYFFLLAKLGCPVKDLRTNKFVKYDDL